MIQQIQLLNQISKNVDFHIDIAGYGTEQLQEYCDGPNFTLHGTVDQGKLNYLLSNVKAILVHQKAGAGALTRIPEMLIAGVPIIANSNACRSAFDYPGVYCYDNQVELAAFMNKSLDFPPILERPVAAERRFIDCFKHLVSLSTESQFETTFDSSVRAISEKLSSVRSHEAKLSGDRP
ncbi:MAG: glycosyltransferase family 4 protein [Scytonema sp. CRU_2_7]|nr:glycosyltransferase family 4 protein [Scytonema sp. CRU_2_7]